MRLIDADDLIKKIQCIPALTGKLHGLNKIILNMPEIEAIPVMHEEWEVEQSLFFPVYHCSGCNTATALGKTNFCPQCGADMRSVTNGERQKL